MPKVKIVSKKTGKAHQFNDFPVVMGRTDDCDLLLGGGGISKKHAIIERQQDGYYITDLNSLNGIAINGKAVQKSIIKNGDEIQLGSARIIFYQLEKLPAQTINSATVQEAPFSEIAPEIEIKEEPSNSAANKLAPIEFTPPATADFKVPPSTNTRSLRKIRSKEAQHGIENLTLVPPPPLTPETTASGSDSTAIEEENLITIRGLSALNNIILDLVANTRHELLILSQNLEREIFSTNQFKSAIFSLARRHKSTKIKILVHNTQDALQTQHQLLDLYRRIPSNLEIRKIDSRFTSEVSDSYIVSDGVKLLHRPTTVNYFATLDYAPSKLLLKKSGEFNHVWEKSKEAVELRQLHI